jgi:two-component system, OmpR family, sensor histidine kinase KdpD
MRLSLQRSTSVLGAAIAIAIVTAAGSNLQLNASTVGFAYIIIVLLASVGGGLLIGTITSVVATLCYNFFFFPPLHTLTIAEPANWFALAAFLVTSVTASRLVVAARVQTQKAERRRNELETLYALSVDLFTATSRAGALGEAAGKALHLLGSKGGGVLLFGENAPDTVAWSGERSEETEARIERAARQKEPLEFASPSGRDIYLPLVIGGKTAGVVVARETEASREALESAASLVALAIERERFMEENAHFEALRESEALKTSLLGAISHDLSTPITAITIRTESLRRRARADDELRDDVEAIVQEIARLRRRIGNLLAMARVEAGKARPRPEPTPAADLFRAARENLPLVFSGRPVAVHVAPDCPDAYVDPSLALEILVNLIENAHRVSPAGAPLELDAKPHPSDAEKVRIEILDRGPGLPPGVTDAEGNITTATSEVAQRGLGLEIARSLAAANGGSVRLAPRPGGGTVARLDVPAALLPATPNLAGAEAP